MSELTNKNILIVGEENSQVQSLIEISKAHGMRVFKTRCEDFEKDIIEKEDIEIIFLNHLHEDDPCKNMLSFLKEDILSRTVPIFALVEDNSEKIQNVLNLGATDFVVPHEETKAVIQKMKAVFSSDDSFLGHRTIDISPIESSVTTKGIRVYVVEDDPLLRNLLSIRLGNSSFPYEFSTDGKAVIELMHKFNPDILILDLMLPGISGFEVLQQVRNDEALKALPVIVFSNRDGQEDRKKAEELGAAAFYVKAMTDLSELVTTIEALTKK
jgi:DNA-binding response OmpR family regulator